jgi:thiaminase/transcriptional activator TenA
MTAGSGFTTSAPPATSAPQATSAPSAPSAPLGAPLSVTLKELGRATWEAAVTHPMVGEIGTGELPHASFRFYFEQNVCYLEDYARAIGLVLAKAPDRDALGILSRFLDQIVANEIPANLDFLERLGGTPHTDPMVAMTPTAYAYTRHILQVCEHEPAAAGLAAILPCQWSYGEIGLRLAASVPDDAIYAAWIAMFSVPDYDDLVGASTSLLDRLTAEAGPAELAFLSAVFNRSTSYEVAFWDMAYGGPPEPAPLGAGPSKESP